MWNINLSVFHIGSFPKKDLNFHKAKLKIILKPLMRLELNGFAVPNIDAEYKTKSDLKLEMALSSNRKKKGVKTQMLTAWDGFMQLDYRN